MTIRPRFLAACFALAPLALTAHAQTAPPPASPAAPVTPTPPVVSTPVTPVVPGPVQPVAPPPPPAPEPPHAPAVIDPAARDLLTQMIAAHKGLHSFIVTIDAQDANSGTVVPTSMVRSRIAFQAPSKAAVTLTRAGKNIGQFVSNGTYFIGVSTAQKKYTKNAIPAPAAGQIIEAQVGRVGLMAQILVNPDGLNGLLTAPSLSTIIKSPDTLTVSGVPVDSVVASLTDPGGRAAAFTFAIGQTDHIIRRITILQQETPPAGTAAKAVSHTETVFALKANPVLPASTFAYMPPKGFQKVAH